MAMGLSTDDVKKIREDFSCLNQEIYGRPLVYFDNGATTQKPKAVIDREVFYYEKACANINRGAHRLSELATKNFEDARKLVARFINAESEKNIVFTRSTTEAINLVAHGLGKCHFEPGDEIILTHMEHHSNIVPWHLWAKEKNLTLKIAQIKDDGSLDLEHFKSLFGTKTKLAAFCHASNALGTLNPIKEMCNFAQKAQVLTLIDGAQAIAHEEVDVTKLGVDFYVFSSHKIYGPTGVGVLYGKKQWLELFPPYQGGGDMIMQVSFDEISFAPAPQKFEAGTPNIAGVIGLAEALKYVEAIGLEKIKAYEACLMDNLSHKLSKLAQVKMIGTSKPRVSLSSFVVEGIHPHDLSSILDRMGVAIRAGHLCTQPLMKRFNVPALARASLAFYNTEEEIEIFINALKKCIEVFK